MFELGTTEHWWEIAKKYPVLSNHKQVLKPLGYSFLVKLIEEYDLKSILEFGHGAGSYLFDLYKGKREMWGLDELFEGNSVPVKSFNETLAKHSHVKFIKGLFGNKISGLPENYFDIICSVSVLEHIPIDKLDLIFSEIFKYLKPGGIFASSYDVYHNQNTKPMFDAIENNGFIWLKSRETMNIFWEKWLNINSNEICDKLFKRVIIENPMIVTECFMWKIEREKRLTPPNFYSVLIAAKKPE